jgi:hypothetical protein
VEETTTVTLIRSMQVQVIREMTRHITKVTNALHII